MGLFGKKNKEELLPDLPEIPGDVPRLPEPPPGQISIQPLDQSVPNLPPHSTLPQLPELEMHNNQQAIKQAISPDYGIRKSEFEQLPQQPLPMNHEPIKAEPANVIEGHHITIPPATIPLATSRTIEISEPPRTTIGSPLKTKPIEPIYIRLDKFQTTTQAFDEIKQKVLEIEKILVKTKEIREKEEKELEEWEHEIQIIKSRIEAIDNTLFKKL